MVRVFLWLELLPWLQEEDDAWQTLMHLGKSG
jgi:hypothetical protein